MRYFKLLILGLVVMLCACNAQRRVLYLQDVESGSEIVLPENYIIRLKPLDQITVVVNSKNPELAMPFNTSTSYNALNGTVTNSTANESSLQVLTVDSKGYIALPVIGKVKVGGLTREEAEAKIEKMIIDGEYIADPKVNVRFANLTVSIIGEVTKPGRYNINKDQLTIFEALALAGDMTIYGNREDVAIIREKEGKSIVTKLDLRSQDIFSSPYFYIEQNDVIIVSPNKYKAATAEINQNRSFWISLTSTAISLATLVITILTVSK
ncbi:MAG: polysaccharide export protein [Alistipes sp.]|nr:polysaccharide export protein [Alistipes sp.]MBR3826596.1 polysaccharide export protein [Alistipes sp.]